MPTLPDITPSTPRTMVAEFHQVFGLDISETPFVPDERVRELRHGLLFEEFEEFAEAVEARDHIEMADAIADMTYVAHGNALVYGIDLEVTSNGRLARVESPVYVGRSLTSDRASVSTFDHYLSAHLLASHQCSIPDVAAALLGVLVEAYRVAAECGYDLDALVTEVHRSNMSKLGADGKPLYRADGKVLKGPNFFTPDVADLIGYRPAA